MPQRGRKAGAIFDVRPVDDTGRVDFAKIESVSLLVKLRSYSGSVRTIKPETGHISHLQEPFEPVQEEKPSGPLLSAVWTKDSILQELEQTLSGESDTRRVLAGLGAAVSHSRNGKPRYRPVLAKKESGRFDYTKIIAEIYRPLHHREETVRLASPETASRGGPAEPKTTGVSAEPARLAALENWYGVSAQPDEAPARHGSGDALPRGRMKLPALNWRRLVLVGGLIFLVGVGVFGFVLHGRVIQEGNAAVQNLENAKVNLEQFDFGAASQDFLLAYQDFSKAAESMHVFGANIGGVLGELPGAGKLKSANNLVEAGKLIAQAGQGMADVVKAVSRTGVVLNPNSNSRVLMAEIITPMKKALQLSDTNLKLVASLMAEVDPSVIPEDKQEMFTQLLGKLPEFQELVGEGMSYTLFFEQFMGSSEPKKYLLLFQNSSELRPTGGFPGSYGIFTLENGRVKDFNADDVYDIDGQLAEVIVPPLQLQHITPNWAMRDAAWFIDFPASARKVMEFYAKEAKQEVQGVITINPEIMADLLSVIGPIEMPEYGLTLTGENFLPSVQSEVEYGENGKINQPKKIIVDLAPLIIQKLYSAPRDKWLEIFNVFTAAMDEKDLLMYFKDPKLEKFVTEKGFGGQVVSTPGDYLMVTFSNIKGSKTDAVTESSLKLDTTLEKDGLTHKLVITRRHDGGKNKYGFYNKQNPSYVRILVPEGSELLSISGNSTPYFQPLLNYPKTDFLRDPELQALEASRQLNTRTGTVTYRESGKTGFGFWMIIDPGEIKTVELEYRVPSALARSDYELYVQKQPGLQWKNFEFTVMLPEGTVIEEATPVLTGSRGRYGLNGELNKDLPIKVRVR